ncbi:MAG TPA: deaminase [Candidatus Bathyarchaeia archaeon]|nr:deaminase [Candidatus Bathyarchaeia archaeon]
MGLVKISNIPIYVPVIGFTGALGSGCSFIADNLAGQRDYLKVGLSDILHQMLREKGLPESVDNLQNLGNDLRKQHGQDYLSMEAITRADRQWPSGHYNGVILDGFRNAAEIEPLSQIPNFHLIAVQASEAKREERLTKKKRCVNHEEFVRTAKRDSEERDSYGQQVSRCMQLADIVIQNEEDVSINMPSEVAAFIHDTLCKTYLAMIERKSQGESTFDFQPTITESLMASAYAVSRRSRCLKRSVGAIVADANGAIVASGFNDVPRGSNACAARQGDTWCNRDIRMQEVGQYLEVCPACGAKIAYALECRNCGQEISQYVRWCPKCRSEIEVDYACVNCGLKIFDKFFPKLLEVCRSLHAEEMALMNMIRNSSAIPSGATLYVTTYPCNLCANKIVAAGVARVIYSESYESSDSKEIFRNGGVSVIPFEGVKNTAYFKFYCCGRTAKNEAGK